MEFWIWTECVQAIVQPARHALYWSSYKAFISLINDVMKANSVKIACKQLDLSLLMNSVSLLISVKGREGGLEGVQCSSLLARQHPKIPLSQ